jgi:TolB-like protein/DNA-binding winged helix-turn-helix (wHTH) protein
MDIISPSQLGAIRFGVFAVDLRAGELRKQGVKIKLQEQPFQVLQVLLEHPGEIVTREELRNRIWPSDTFVDFDGGVNNAIKRLREALGDRAETPRFIETIPRRGYRFMGPVNGMASIPADGSPSTAEPRAQPRTSPRTLRTGILIGLGFAALLLAILGLIPNRWWQHFQGGRDAPQIRSIAVLPLQNLSGDPAQEYFADAMTEELITELSRISALRVISRTSVMRYKKTDKLLPEIARELGAEEIVEGSVLRSGDRVRITAQLIHAPKDTNVWAQTYDRDLQDVLTLQSRVASTIAAELRVKLTPGEQVQLHSWRPVNLRAHEAYLQGRYHLQLEGEAVFKKDKRRLAAGEAEKAEEYFRQAIQEDPNYAPPYLGIWEVLQSAPLPWRDTVPRAKPLLHKALQLDDSLAEAHRAVASVLRVHDWDWPGAEKEYQRALQLAPSDADAHSEYASFLAAVEGRTQDAIKEYELAQSLDPKSDRMAEAFYFTRQFDRAIEAYQSQVQLRPSDDFLPHFALANIYALTGRNREAISEWQKMATILEYKETSQAIGRAYKSGGYNKALRVLAAELEASSREAYIPFTFVASIYGYMGDRDKAFAWLEKAYEARDGVDNLRDPMWDPVRSDPRFAEMVRRVGLPE